MYRAGMAQSVEHVIGNDEVTGPIPVTSSKKSEDFCLPIFVFYSYDTAIVSGVVTAPNTFVL